MKRTRPVYGLSLPKVGVGSRRSVQGVGQRYRNRWAEVRKRLHAQVVSVVAFQESDTPSGGWGGTDRLGVLYEWRVIRSQADYLIDRCFIAGLAANTIFAMRLIGPRSRT
jgi:hypothetical protein